ncbi:MAG: hypothetical protein ACRETL_10175, partial [Gammaproteobacteria bacterium]
MKRIFFFATPADIMPLLQRFETYAPVKYAEIVNQTSPTFSEYRTGADIPNPGISTHETGGLSISYLVATPEFEWTFKPFHGSNGESRWYLNNGDNKSSIVLTMSGLWKDMLLPGKVDTLHDTPDAQQLMRNFLSAIKAEKFAKIKLFWLGREAHEMLKSGVRLST